ncbi:lipase [Streptoalloteichus tenebrarius]|uniref:Lipase n=1 Tax=Streptoalloteichus tenebrarius (strain ATCC 17920 / DSM 40477 / JCM 4838 / CBS 697.72 / NBRC 16177 / NCIMB 11028 / NRRL B-12390 / A12253. 1 / ISP 5477) TaxID=1933 RepID=A0ABT1HVS0_STRSD|nr:alpha/beta fold hydrolase [Streptoalloteichus tenebrarius]MCP2259621.1 lipase [Streptoalloteichus tenebrarius]BFF00973.1 alpha/beta hydrolase [Streptoalloteichus tenebrarius]
MTEGSLYVHELGDPAGPPLIALHGITGHGARWRRLVAEHLADLRVIAPDLRGHGRSPHVPPWTLERHAQDVLAVLDALDLGRVPVLAHSFGGAVALHLARLAPERVAGLVLLDPAIGMDPQVALEQAECWVRPDAYEDRAEARREQAGLWPTAAEEVVEQELDDNLVLGEDGRWRWRFCSASITTAWSEIARPHVVPPAGTRTLLVPAEGTDFVRPGFVADCRDALGDALAVEPLDCGHMIYLERPAEVAKLVRDFVGG